MKAFALVPVFLALTSLIWLLGASNPTRPWLRRICTKSRIRKTGSCAEGPVSPAALAAACHHISVTLTPIRGSYGTMRC